MRIVEQGWHRPHEGRVDRWVSLAVIAAAIATFVFINLGFHDTAPGAGMWWITTGLDVGFIGMLIAIGTATNRQLSVTTRLAVALPCFHLLMFGVAWIANGAHVFEIQLHAWMPIDDIPIPMAFGIVFAAVSIGGTSIARHPSEGWRTVASVALAFLLLLGLWLPMALRIFHPRDIPSCVMVLAPPFVVAWGYSAVAVRARRLVRVIAPFGLIAGVAAALANFGQPNAVWREYGNFGPWVLASVVSAILAIIALGISTRRRTSRADGIEGRIESSSIVAGFELHSWLRGPEPFLVAHEVRTSRGIARIPATAHFAAPLPRSSTVMRSNEGVPLLSDGDRVRLVGFVPVDEGSPFRDSHTLVPGDHPEVHLVSDDTDRREQLVLAAWRPAIAYLLVVLAVGAPALITLSKAH